MRVEKFLSILEFGSVIRIWSTEEERTLFEGRLTSETYKELDDITGDILGINTSDESIDLEIVLA
jgi:hypothetical protein